MTLKEFVVVCLRFDLSVVPKDGCDSVLNIYDNLTNNLYGVLYREECTAQLDSDMNYEINYPSMSMEELCKFFEEHGRPKKFNNPCNAPVTMTDRIDELFRYWTMNPHMPRKESMRHIGTGIQLMYPNKVIPLVMQIIRGALVLTIVNEKGGISFYSEK